MRPDFLREVGVTPPFRNLTAAARSALANEAVPVRVEPGRFLVHEEAPEDVFILGEGTEIVAVDILWEGDEAWQSVARLRRGAVIGAANLRGPSASHGVTRDPRERFEVVHGGTVWRIPARHLDRVRGLRLVGDGSGKGFQPDSTETFFAVLERWEWIWRSADAAALVPRERLRLAELATVETVSEGDVVQEADTASRALTLLGPGAAVRARHAHLPDDAPHWIIGRGGMFGYGVRQRRAQAPIRLTCVHSGPVLRWDARTLRGLAGAFGHLRGSWIDTFLDERLAIYEAVLPVAMALLGTPLLQGISIGQILALLQGSSLIDWRVGGAPPVPIGIKAGLGVVVDGEVVGYRLQPTLDHNSVQMMRFDPTSVCRGVPLDVAGAGPVDPSEARWRAFGSEGCARLLLGSTARESDSALPTHRWRARVPSRVLFIPAHRLGEVMGVKDGQVIEQLPESSRAQARRLLDNARSIHRRHETAVQDRIVLDRLDSGPGRVRDAINLLWVQRVDGRPLDPTDVGLLETLGHHLSLGPEDLGFQERTLLVRLVPGEHDDPLPDTSSQRRVVSVDLPVGVDPIGRMKALLANATGFANVLVWPEDPMRVDTRLASAVDTVLLLSWDPKASLPRSWPVETPYLYAQLVRTDPTCSLPATAVRLHALTERGAPEEGWASREAALGRWARAVTRRQVGIALGGGGAWGWAHVALMRAAHARHIPIDVVSGASFGSVAGAYFALGGPVGLRYAIAHDQDIQRAVNRAMATGKPLEDFIDGLPTAMATWAAAHEVGLARFAANVRALVPPERRTDATLPAVPLTHLPIPFFPVATELVMGSEHPRLTGTIGRGVRASGSLPPVFPVLREPGRNYADGGLSQNVPANIVETEGVAIIVASNIVPPPFLQDPRPVRSGVRGLLSSLNPVSRTVSMAVGVQTLFNRSGAVDTSMAPVVFQSAWTGTFLSQIDRADTIVSDTMANQQFWQALDGLRSRWGAVRRPRPGLSRDLGTVRVTT